MRHPAKQWHYETLGRRAVEALKANRFDAVFAADASEATRIVLSMIPRGATVGFGTSMTLQAIGLTDRLQETPGEYRLLNPPWIDGRMGREERIPLRRQAMAADVFLSGTNAVTLDGQMVNIDATGNRVAGMLFGPKKTIVVVGVNKIVHTLQEALDRVTHVASPPNARRLNYDTPCAVTGVCSDCRSDQRICNATVILHRKTNGVDMTVVVVGEDLGF